ncbi:hypothetical protein VPHK394_0032 [Vibrio phage K394]
MESLKMSEMFKGKVVVDSSTGAVGGGCVEIGDNDGWIAHFGYSGDFSKSDSNEMATYAAHAINNHDRLVEENAELREVLKLLVEKGIEVNNIDEVEDEEGAFTVQCNFNDALIKASQLLNKQ